MTAVKSGLMIIDQYRADIRILYDRYMTQMDNHTGYSFAINGVPAGIEGLAPERLLRQLVADASMPGAALSALNAQVALSLARHAAIPYGQILSNEEMENIINELFSCSNVNYTPDGKAILCILPQGDIEHLLG